MSPTASEKAFAREYLLAIFDRSGRLRPPPVRTVPQPSQHKGHEVRLRVHDEDELDDTRYALAVIGIKPGAPYAHANGWVIPLYGPEAFEWFLKRRPRDLPKRKRFTRAPTLPKRQK